MIARYVTRTLAAVAATLAAMAATLAAMVLLALAPAAEAASSFNISGGGDGHGIGMSQYGAYGYAQHGWSYRQILAHYYQGTAIGATPPSQLVRVLLGTGGSASDLHRCGLRRRPSCREPDRESLDGPEVLHEGADGRDVALYSQTGQQLISARPPLVVSGPGPLDFAGHGQFRGSTRVPLGNRGEGPNRQRGRPRRLRPRRGLGRDACELVGAGPPGPGRGRQDLRDHYRSVDGNGYTLYSDTRSQMYQGVAAETPSTDAAVANTRGQVVTYNGRPVATYFFASSGGYTGTVQNVWIGSNPEPWLRGVPDPYDNAGGNPYYRWSK